MSRSTSLTCQSTKVCIVIRKGISIPTDKIKAYCEKYFHKYAFIEHLHTFDVDGTEIPVHYHIVGDFLASKVAFSTRLNTIVDFFGFDSAIGIEIEKYTSLEKSIQYLTHKNQPEKTPLSVENVITNIPKEDFDLLYTSDNGSIITFDTIYSLCYQHRNIIGVIKDIGIGNYRTWRNVILDVFNNIER